LCSGCPGYFGNLRWDIIPAPVRELVGLFVDESRLDRDAALVPHTRDNSRR
jgi:hypothetical protein